MFTMFKEPMGELFMTEQLLLKKGLKHHFGKSGADAVINQLRTTVGLLRCHQTSPSKKPDQRPKTCSTQQLPYVSETEMMRLDQGVGMC
jgi:hypothetical protein